MSVRLITQFVDADLLEVLPGDVGHVVDVLVALLGESLVVLAQPQQVQPLQHVVLKHKHYGSIKQKTVTQLG